MKSMTGFGRGGHVGAGTRYAVEISTVNRRNAELVFNLPRELAPFENLLRETIAPAVARGRATVTASISAGPAARPLLDPALFRRIRDELASVQRALRIPGTPSLSDLVRLYSVTAREGSAAASPDPEALAAAARAAVRDLEAMRRREGAHLARELRGLLAVLAREVAAIRRLAPSVAKRHGQSLRARLAAADVPFAPGDERLAREIALFAERCDITEELARLESHIAQFRSGLAADGAHGRTLDFLAQEMLRECNTVGSKSNSAAVTRRVIAAKTELERLREQVQNVE